jgi:drug/metabolite transporter (DMT)-like permease
MRRGKHCGISIGETAWRGSIPVHMGILEAIFLNGVFIAIVGHGLIGGSLVWDKVLLQRRETKNLLAYVFWLGAISVFGLIVGVFGFRIPTFEVAGLGFLAGVLDLVASFFYYWALKAGEASDELAVMGGFTPVATVLIAIPFLHTPAGGSVTGFALMVAGGLVMFFAEKQPLAKMLPKILLAASCFGLTNVLQKIVFNQTNFPTGFVFFTFGTFVGSVALLVPPSWRKQIFEYSEEATPRSKFWYMVNRFMAGLGSFLIVFAISRATPAVVSAISGLRYVIIFVGAYAITKLRPDWFREDFRRRALILKSVATCLVITGLVLVGLQGGGAASGP